MSTYRGLLAPDAFAGTGRSAFLRLPTVAELLQSGSDRAAERSAPDGCLSSAMDRYRGSTG